MSLSKPQKTVADCKSRFRVLIAGRRFGKSYLSINELAKFARHPDKKCLYVAPSYKVARQSIWDDLKNKLLAVRWVKKINDTSMTITLKNNSIIMIRSADNYDGLRGLGIDFAVFDEIADIKPETWTEVVRYALAAQTPVGHALFIGTPKGATNWAKELYDMGTGYTKQKDWQSFQYTSIEGGLITDEEIETQRATSDPRTFRQEMMATFESYLLQL